MIIDNKIERLDINDMKSFDVVRPGKKVKIMLLYFPCICKYMIYEGWENADGEFIFENNKRGYASYWLELEDSNIPL